MHLFFSKVEKVFVSLGKIKAFNHSREFEKIFGDRLTAGQYPLKVSIQVRILVPEPNCTFAIFGRIGSVAGYTDGSL